MTAKDLEKLGFTCDPTARSLAFYASHEPLSIDVKAIEALKSASREAGNGNARLCLHIGPDAPFHEMIVLEHAGRYYRPHKHLSKGESCRIIEGELLFVIFDEDGKVSNSFRLSPNNVLNCRIGAECWHTVIPITPTVLYQETKPGPFVRKGDSVFPTWAPTSDNPTEGVRFLDRVTSFCP